MHRPLPLLLLLTACGGGTRDWAFADVLAVDAGLSNGELSVFSEPRDDVLVSWEGGGVGRKAISPDVFVEDGVLTVDAMAGLLSGGEVEITVPEGMPIRGRVERGDLCIDLSARAHVEACVAAGGVYMTVPEGDYRLDLDVGAGDLSVEGVTHRDDADKAIRACVAAGDLSIYGASAGGSW